MFRNREDAGRRLAQKLAWRPLTHPVVLAIPRGGVVVGAMLARGLAADLDVILSRKLRDPDHLELALGAVTEDGRVVLNEYGHRHLEFAPQDIERERVNQLDEIARRREMVRAIKPQERLEGRSVIVTDDGIATGSTLIAALETVREQRPREIIVAAPVAAPERLRPIQRLADEVICLLKPVRFGAVSQFYDDFRPVSDETVMSLLRELSRGPTGARAETARNN